MTEFTYGIEFAVVAALGIAVCVYHYLDIKKDSQIMDQETKLNEEKIKADLANKSDVELDAIIESRGSSEKPKA